MPKITPRSSDSTITVKTSDSTITVKTPGDWWNANSKKELTEKLLGIASSLNIISMTMIEMSLKEKE